MKKALPAAGADAGERFRYLCDFPQATINSAVRSRIEIYRALPTRNGPPPGCGGPGKNGVPLPRRKWSPLLTTTCVCFNSSGRPGRGSAQPTPFKAGLGSSSLS